MPVFRKDGKNILFVHVPKCGGSSIENAFRDSGYSVLGLDRSGGKKSANYQRVCSPQHMHADLLQRTLRIGRFDMVFMVVREPIARFRSEYVYRHRKQETVSKAAVDISKWAEKNFRAYEKDPYVLDNHLRPQDEFWLPEARVYRLEDGLETMIQDLNSTFELGVEWQTKRVLHSKAEVGFSSSEVELSDELHERLTDFYAADFERFGYEPGVKPVPAAPAVASDPPPAAVAAPAVTPAKAAAAAQTNRLVRKARAVARALRS